MCWGGWTNGTRSLLPGGVSRWMLSCLTMANRAVQAVCFLPYLAKTFAESRAEQPAPGQVIPTIVKQESIRLWLSPWGGYNKPRDTRVSHAKEYGFETVDGKLALSGPNYFKNFNEQIVKLIKNEHITR